MVACAGSGQQQGKLSSNACPGAQRFKKNPSVSVVHVVAYAAPFSTDVVQKMWTQSKKNDQAECEGEISGIFFDAGAMLPEVNRVDHWAERVKRFAHCLPRHAEA